MEDDEIRAHFDGRARVALLPGNITASKRGRADEIAHALGYRPAAVHNVWPVGVQLVYERDDAPHACRRRELTIARLREGGPLLSEIAPPPPPPPGPPPPAPAQSRVGPRRPGRLSAEPPPPPSTVAPAGARIPPPPPFPPPPPPPPVTPTS